MDDYSEAKQGITEITITKSSSSNQIMPISNIVLATAGAKGAEAALRTLIENDWTTCAKFHVVAIAHDVPAGIRFELPAAEAAADRAVKELAQKYGGDKVVKHVAQGHPEEAIIEYIKENNADLLLIGAHAKQDMIHELILGSTATHLAVRSPCTPLIVRPGSSGVLKRVLVCIDSPKTTARTLEALAEQPWPSDVQFRLFSVFVPPNGEYSHCPPVDVQMSIEAEAKKRARVEAHMTDTVTMLKEKMPAATIERQVVYGINVPETIIRACHEFDADLIVLGPREHVGVDEFFIGSVSQGLLPHLPCNIEMIR